MKAAVFLLLRISLLPDLIRLTLQRRRVTALIYHQVEPEVLDRHLSVLLPRYHIIPLRRFVEALAAGKVGSLPPRALILTLDDGHAVSRGLLPVLRKYRVPATIFVCTGIVGTRRQFWFRSGAAQGEVQRLKDLPDGERMRFLRDRGFDEEREAEERQALTWEEIEDMREWVDFQPHTLFHPVLPRCEDERAWQEILQSRTDLEEKGHRVHTFAYPNGDCGPRDVDLVRRAGYVAAMTGNPWYNTGATDPYRLKRIAMNDRAGSHEALVRASGLWTALRMLVKGRP